MNVGWKEERLNDLIVRMKAGEIDRRMFHTLAVALLGAGAFAGAAGSASADAKRLVLVNWGGEALQGYDKAFGQPFFKSTGIEVKEDGTGPTEGAVIAQYKSGRPTWDVLDIDVFSAMTLGAKGMLEPIDYSIVDKSKMRPGTDWKYAASTYFLSYVIAYDTTRFGTNPPKDLKDFFDVARFPGKRALYKWGTGVWEAALLADGVAREKLYPLDLARANAKISRFKDNVITFWGGGAESQQVLLSGDASMAIIWSTRADNLDRDSQGQIKFTWNQGMLSPGALGVMKNNPAGRDAAMRFIASTADPSRQKIMFEMLGQGPANPETEKLIPANQQIYNPVAPENVKVQIPLDVAWYAEHYSSALEDYTRLISA